MRLKEIYCYDLTMSQKLFKMGYKCTYAKLVHGGNIAFCFEDVGNVREELEKMIEAKRAKRDKED